MTKKQLAEMLDLSAQSITSFEAEKVKPADATVERMAFALGFPVSFFYARDINLAGAEDATFRARRSLKASERDKAVATGVIATEIISTDFARRFKFPALDLPDLAGEDFPAPDRNGDYDWPEAAARLLREHWKLGNGPIHNMVHLLESKGIEVYWVNEPVASLDAFSLWRNERPYVILNNDKKAGCRTRYNAAHELGHLLLHRHEKSVDGREVERQANRFASAFLMPAEQFKVESPKMPALNRYGDLKRRWGVSIQAMVRRGFDLGLYSEWYYEEAIKAIYAAGWRTEEPHPIPRERSMLHQLVLDRLSAKSISASDYAKTLHLPFSDFCEIIPTADGFTPTGKPKTLEEAEPELRRNGVVLKMVG